MTSKHNSDTPKKLTEGHIKKGGVGARPTVPRPSINPAGQKPGPKSR
jgi:hypothetical protein